MRIFFSGPLTNLKNPEKTKKFYLQMAQVASDHGYSYYWAFLRKKNGVLSPSQIYETHTAELRSCDLVIAYIGEASFGAGIEIEHARVHGIPVYIFFEEHKTISAMLLGSPAIRGRYPYSTEKDCMEKLAALLEAYPDAFPDRLPSQSLT